MKDRHDPRRFQVFQEDKDGRGIVLPTGEHFSYDPDGGWRDEYGHKYDRTGKPVYNAHRMEETEVKPQVESPQKIEIDEDRFPSDVSWDKSDSGHEDPEELEMLRTAAELERFERRQDKHRSILKEIDEKLMDNDLMNINCFSNNLSKMAKTISETTPIAAKDIKEFPADAMLCFRAHRDIVARVLELETSLPPGLEASFYLDEDQS